MIAKLDLVGEGTIEVKCKCKLINTVRIIDGKCKIELSRRENSVQNTKNAI
jgi:hypothetical protein